MTQAVRGALLLALAGVIAKLLVTGQMALYMSPALDPLSGATAVVLAAMAAVELWSAARARHAHAPSGDAGHPGSNSPADELLTYLVVAVLVGVGTLVAPRALDSSALGGVQAARAVVAFSPAQPPAANSVAPPTTPIADVADLFRYLRLAGESAVGQPVRVVGMAVRDGSLAPNQFVLLRYTIVHCVADAQPIGLLIDASQAPAPPLDGGWVAIDGVLAASSIDNSHLVSVRATRVLPSDEPPEPYLWNL